jgi:hypothetical protein
MPKHKFLTLALVFALVAVASSRTLACALHVTNLSSFFAQTYPGSLNVAMAVGNARSENRLPGTPLENGELGLLRASYALNKLGHRLNVASLLPKTDFFLMFAGQQMWTYYRAKTFTDQFAYGVHVHSAEPNHDVPILVTSYYVVLALQEGVMTFTEALDDGFIQIRNDKEGSVTTMFLETFDSI